MAAIAIDFEGYSVRDELRDAHARAWAQIAAPGTWLDGARRVAVAAEARRAGTCALCRRRKEALSPYTVAGEHETLGALTPAEVDAVHRIATDSGRLTESWLAGLRDSGLGEGAYVEIVGVVSMVMILDTVRRALGLPPVPLPEPVAGAPTGYRPPGARKGGAWVAWVDPDDVVDSDGAIYPPGRRFGLVQWALSSVPQAKRDYWELAHAHYLPSAEMANMATQARAVSRSQMELMAARVSALHGCFY